ncbi:hypothetical protein [Pseudophaeobacter sp.]|uniref:hypothetical protein n=1 Tax=Pseudophaeobacter sp. TaxID=1971739 RepID=UPI004058A1B8
MGESGPETIWNSKGAYVAHAGATERLSRMAERAGPMMAALGGGLRKAMGRAQVTAAPVLEQIQRPRFETGATGQEQSAAAAGPASQVVQHIQIVAAHLSVAQIADDIERRGRAALFDEPHGYGQCEGG